MVFSCNRGERVVVRRQLHPCGGIRLFGTERTVITLDQLDSQR